MTSRTALAAVLLLPALAALAGPVPASYAAATCQGQAATIESPGGVVHATEGDDVIVSTGGDANIYAKGGNDLVCIVGGFVSTGPGNDSVVSTAPDGEHTEVGLEGGADSYVSTGGARSLVYVKDTTSVHVDLGPGGGDVWLEPTTTAGTGSVDLGARGGNLYANGLSEAHVDLRSGTAGVDDLLNVSIANVDIASGYGATVRLVGDDRPNELKAHGCTITMRGGDGRDELVIVGGGDDRTQRDEPRCRRPRSLLKGEDGPDLLRGRGDDDVLLGGRGRDVAKGSFGTDRCVAEREKNCER